MNRQELIARVNQTPMNLVELAVAARDVHPDAYRILNDIVTRYESVLTPQQLDFPSMHELPSVQQTLQGREVLGGLVLPLIVQATLLRIAEGTHCSLEELLEVGPSEDVHTAIDEIVNAVRDLQSAGSRTVPPSAPEAVPPRSARDLVAELEQAGIPADLGKLLPSLSSKKLSWRIANALRNTHGGSMQIPWSSFTPAALATVPIMRNDPGAMLILQEVVLPSLLREACATLCEKTGRRSADVLGEAALPNINGTLLRIAEEMLATTAAPDTTPPSSQDPPRS